MEEMQENQNIIQKLTPTQIKQRQINIAAKPIGWCHYYMAHVMILLGSFFILWGTKDLLQKIFSGIMADQETIDE